MRTPLAVPPSWAQVIEAADGRCQCRGACGRKHRPTRGVTPVEDGRCEAAAARERLIVAPSTPTDNPHEAATAPLSAWCEPCYTTALVKARRAERDTTVPDEPSLFDVDL